MIDNIKQVFYPYDVDLDHLAENFELSDHLGGFDIYNENQFLRKLNTYAETHRKRFCIQYHQVLSRQVIDHYQNLQIEFDINFQDRFNLSQFLNYHGHPELNFKNFVCSFNGSPHVSRQLLVSILQKFGYFDPEYSSKNFSYPQTTLDSHIAFYTHNTPGADHRLYRKFFIADSEEFFQKIYSFGHVRFDHANNIYNLENKIAQSFINLVSETMATSYQPFVTEKFLYSIITKGLFVAYAQPGWHDHIEKYYGFKKYTKLFDYRFDTVSNPVERLVELISMISKFNTLSTHDWHDLYLIEQDTIEYNYNHYFSRAYLECLKNVKIL